MRHLGLKRQRVAVGALDDLLGAQPEAQLGPQVRESLDGTRLESPLLQQGDSPLGQPPLRLVEEDVTRLSILRPPNCHHANDLVLGAKIHEASHGEKRLRGGGAVADVLPSLHRVGVTLDALPMLDRIRPNEVLGIGRHAALPSVGLLQRHRVQRRDLAGDSLASRLQAVAIEHIPRQVPIKSASPAFVGHLRELKVSSL
mmetsp:Transcript_38815/g.98525  ORF Transcript_38815/g.98525 Transcript_38815/m.98525 type:complete len:200 (-) Transcript_38815:442-1041(-)